MKLSVHLHQVEGKFARQSGGRGQYGHVWIEFSPNEEGKGFEFVNGIVGGVVPREYIPAVQAGLEDSLRKRCSCWISIS